MPTIAIHAPELSGETGLTLYLYTEAGVLTNTGGDALSESPASSGRFAASVDETISATHHARVHDAAGVVRDGWLPSSGTLIQDAYPGSASAAAIADAVCDELLSGHTTAGSLAKTLSNLAQNVSSGRITVVSRIEGDTITLHIDDDYKVRSGTELEIPVTDAGSVLFTRLDALDLDDLSFGAAREGQSAGEITGTVANLTHANGVTTFTIEITGCGSGLRPGTGLYQIQSSETHSNEHDDHIEVSGPLVLERRVVAPRG